MNLITKKGPLNEIRDSCLLWQVASSKDSPSGGREITEQPQRRPQQVQLKKKGFSGSESP